MAIANMGRPVGASIVGALGEGEGALLFWICAAVFATIAALVLVVRFPGHASEPPGAG